jgi:hypothetical protein
MSDVDINAGHEAFDLDHGQEQFADSHDSLHDFNAFDNQHNFDLDEHFAQGHHIEADTPDSHFSETDYTNADVHVSDSSDSFGVHDLNADQGSSYGDVDLLHESGDSGFLSEHAYDGGNDGSDLSGLLGEQSYDDGAGEVSAVSS